MDENRQERLEKMLSRYCETRDVGLRNELVTEYMYLADAVARRYAGRGVDYEDLRQIAAMALIGALDALVSLSGALYVLLYLFGLAFSFYPLVKWCRENEGFSWPWPHVESEKKRIKKLRREQEQQSGSEKK